VCAKADYIFYTHKSFALLRQFELGLDKENHLSATWSGVPFYIVFGKAEVGLRLAL
jgi:hypothetical protein